MISEEEVNMYNKVNFIKKSMTIIIMNPKIQDQCYINRQSTDNPRDLESAAVGAGKW